MKSTTIESIDVLEPGRATTSALKSALHGVLARWRAAETAEMLREDLAGVDDHLLRDIGVLDAAHPRRGR